MRRLLRLFAVLLTVSVAIAPASAASPPTAKDAVFDVPALLSTPLNPRVLKQTTKDGIVTEEVMFHSHMDGEKSVDIFGLFSYPIGARHLPAYIWNQGGLAQATPDWTEAGARRGYAVLCIDFPMPHYRSTGDYPIVSGVELTDDPRQAPIYHGAVALLKAVSYLETRAEVDRERIGMAGSSWGGFYTTLMAGIDTRIKAATCMFGSGALQLGNIWWDGSGESKALDAAFRERWRTTLDPARRLATRKVPIAWFTGTNDWFYWMPAVMESYKSAAGPKHLSLLANWDHAIPGNLVQQIFVWLDVHLKGAKKFNTVGPVTISRKGNELTATWSFQGPRPVDRAELILSYGEAGVPLDTKTKTVRPGTPWNSRYWLTLPATISKNACSVRLPPSTIPYYVGGAVWDKEDFQYSTPIVKVNPWGSGAAGSNLLAYDGASEWGGFEPWHAWYVDQHGGALPEPVKDAREGEYSVRLEEGSTIFPGVFFTSGVAHEFSAYLKAAKPTSVTVELGGIADGKALSKKQRFNIGTKWTQVQFSYTPPAGLAIRLEPTFTVAAGTRVLLDAVKFRPVIKASPKAVSKSGSKAKAKR